MTDVIDSGALDPNTGAAVLVPEVLPPAHGARTHHKNSPSKLPYLAACPGFASDDTGDKDAAERGTRLHEHMDGIVQAWVKDRSKPLLQHLEDFSRLTALDADERSLLVFCIRELAQWVSRSGAEIMQEIRVEVHRPDGSLVTAGHLDLLIVFNGRTALLIDYKFGWLRVKDAAENEQGLAYALGALEKLPALELVAICFLQPRLGLKTSAILKRADVLKNIDQISAVVELAEKVQRQGFDPGTIPLLNTGTQCLYCAHTRAGTCPARLRVLTRTVKNMAPLEFPSNWSAEHINTPEQAAMARYAAERIEDFLGPVKERAREIALAAPDQRIAVTLATGEQVAYKVQQVKHDRTVGAAVAVAKALENVLTLEEVLGCADLKLGRLEEAATNAIHEMVNEQEKTALAALDERHRLGLISGATTKANAERERRALRGKFSERRITKKDATEQFQALLTSQGLLTREEGTTPQLRRDKSSVKQLTPVNK